VQLWKTSGTLQKPVPGWKLQKPRATEFVDAEHIAQAVESGKIGAGNAIKAAGSMSAKKAEQLWSEAGAVMPEGIVSRKVGQAPLVASK
jgi:nitrous oxide reductase accessory protein NosL